MSRFVQIPPTELAELCRRVKEGDVAARNRIVEHNRWLAVQIARRWPLPDHCERDDLTQWGMAGLMTAAERFDPARGVCFSTYASHWIKESIRRGLKQRLVRIPNYLYDQPAREHKYHAHAAAALFVESLSDRGRYDDEYQPVATGADVHEEIERVELRERLHAALAQLDERSRYILSRRCGAGGPTELDVIGREFGLSRERVRQIERQAIRRLATLMGEDEGQVISIRDVGRRRKETA